VVACRGRGFWGGSVLVGRSGTTFSGRGPGLLLVPREPRVDWAAGLTAHFGATGVERRQGGMGAIHLRSTTTNTGYQYEHIA